MASLQKHFICVCIPLKWQLVSDSLMAYQQENLKHINNWISQQSCSNKVNIRLEIAFLNKGVNCNVL